MLSKAASSFPTALVTSLKRDEERSFRLAPYARTYYICAALSADRLAPSRTAAGGLDLAG